MIYVIAIITFTTFIYISAMIYVIIGFIKIRKKGNIKSTSENRNKISVIISARNEEKNILKCLKSLKRQSYEISDYEIIVIDDHSTDETKNLINNFMLNNKLSIQLVSSTENVGKKEGLEFGIKRSNYDIIATTDADCILPYNWLKNISLQFDNETDMLLGPIVFEKKNGFLSSFQILDMMAIQGMEFGAIYFKNPILNNGANLSYLKKSFKNVNGLDLHDTPSGDDVFLLEKFKSKNKKIKGLLAEDFIVETSSESTLMGFLNQRLRWASKAKYYSDKSLIFFSAIVLFQNISLIFIYLGIPLVEKYSKILIILLICKWLIDFILLFLVASFFKRKKKLFYFIPVQLVYPIYIFVIWVASITMKFEWKGRKF